jgi:hypothetical protein
MWTVAVAAAEVVHVQMALPVVWAGVRTARAMQPPRKVQVFVSHHCVCVCACVSVCIWKYDLCVMQGLIL